MVPARAQIHQQPIVMGVAVAGDEHGLGPDLVQQELGRRAVGEAIPPPGGEPPPGLVLPVPLVGLLRVGVGPLHVLVDGVGLLTQGHVVRYQGGKDLLRLGVQRLVGDAGPDEGEDDGPAGAVPRPVRGGEDHPIVPCLIDVHGGVVHGEEDVLLIVGVVRGPHLGKVGDRLPQIHVPGAGAEDLGRLRVGHDVHRPRDLGPVPPQVHRLDGHGLGTHLGPVGGHQVGVGELRLVLRKIEEHFRSLGMIEIPHELLWESQNGGHGVHHVEPLDAGHLVHLGQDIVAAGDLGHEPGHHDLPGEPAVQGLLGLLHVLAGEEAAAGLPGEGHEIGDKDLHGARRPIPAGVRYHHGHRLIAVLRPVWSGVKSEGQGRHVPGGLDQAFRRQGLPPLREGHLLKIAYRRHRVPDHQGRFEGLPLRLQRQSVDPRHGGVHGGRVRDKAARHGVVGHKGVDGRHVLPRLDGHLGHGTHDDAAGFHIAHVPGHILQPDLHGPLPRLVEDGRRLEAHGHQLLVHQVRKESVGPQLLVHAQDLGDALGLGGGGVPELDLGDAGAVPARHQHPVVGGLCPVDPVRIEGIAALAPILHEGGGGRTAPGKLPDRHRPDLPIEPVVAADGQRHQKQEPLQQKPKPAGPMRLSLLGVLHGRASIKIRSYHKRKHAPCQ